MLSIDEWVRVELTHIASCCLEQKRPDLFELIMALSMQVGAMTDGKNEDVASVNRRHS